MNNVAKSFNIPAINLSALYNYFDEISKNDFQNYITKFLDTLTNPSFPYICALLRLDIIYVITELF